MREEGDQPDWDQRPRSSGRRRWPRARAAAITVLGLGPSRTRAGSRPKSFAGPETRDFDSRLHFSGPSIAPSCKLPTGPARAAGSGPGPDGWHSEPEGQWQLDPESPSLRGPHAIRKFGTRTGLNRSPTRSRDPCRAPARASVVARFDKEEPDAQQSQCA